MKSIIALSFMLTTVEICMSTVTKIFYVLPDNSTDANCLSQPCATLSEYYNGTLPVVSNVEYHFLPGEHHVPANMKLMNLHNFSIVGIISKTSPVTLVGCLQLYTINIINSQFVIIKNIVFKHCGIISDKKTKIRNLKMSCCLSCKIQNVTFLQYGFKGFDLIGETYLYNIKFMDFSEICCQRISLYFYMFTCLSGNGYWDHIPNNVMINRLLNHNYTKMGLHLDLDYSVYTTNILLINSQFYMGEKDLVIKNRCSLATNRIIVRNCTFKLITAGPAIHIKLSANDQIVSIVNCNFLFNKNYLIKISVIDRSDKIDCMMLNKTFSLTVTKISFIRCQFNNNKDTLLEIVNTAGTLADISLEFLNISHNAMGLMVSNLISVTKMNVYINGLNVVDNHVHYSNIVQFQSCDILFSGKIKFKSNDCYQVISLDTHIKAMEHASIIFVNNRYKNKLIAVAEQFNQPYPFCLFQYIAMNSNTLTKELTIHYDIIFKYNYILLTRDHLHKTVIALYLFVILSLIVNGYLQQHFITTTLKLLTNKLFKMMIRIVTIINISAIVLKVAKKLIVVLIH